MLCDAASLAVIALVLLGALHDRTEESAALRTFSSARTVTSEISYKADLIEALKKPPQLVFFGGSRSQRFDPAHAESKTGLRSFNLAVSNGHPEGAWALANWLLARAPGTRLRWIWGLQWSTFYQADMEPGLLQDERFNWYFPDALLRGQRSTLAQAGSGAPLQNRRYADNGLLLSNSYDKRRAEGYTLEQSLAHYIKKARRKQLGEGHQRATKSRAQIYFEKTLRLLNDNGTTPVIVLMPVHPTVVRALSDSGLSKNRRHLLSYLRSLKSEYRLKIVDLSRISSFGGDPSGFYDGVHMTRANSNKAMDAILKEAAAQVQ